jgi:hypothetical protein
MPAKGLSDVIGMAVVDLDFRRRLLNDPAIALNEFDLTPQERTAVTRCRAESLEEFARTMYVWLTAQDEREGYFRGPPEPMQAPTPGHQGRGRLSRFT